MVDRRFEFSVKDAQSVINEEIGCALYEVKKLTKVDDEEDVTEEMLMKLNKKQLVDLVLEMTRALCVSNETLSGATCIVGELQTSQIKLQQEIIDQKDALIKLKDDQIQSVQTTVKTELRSYCEAAKKGVAESGITAAQVKMAVKTAVKEEDRSRNIMLFGVAEENEETVEEQAAVIFEQVEEKPRIVDCHRIGEAKDGVHRPIKVTLASSDSVQRVLRNAGRLKRSESFKAVFIAADRTVEERAARKELVAQLKQKREREPGLYHFIRNGTILSRSGSHVGS